MTRIRTRIHIVPDGTPTGRAEGLPVGDHEAEIRLSEPPEALAASDVEALLAGVRAIQAEVAQLPIRDDRSPDEIIGCDKHGHLD